jgi:hypothetical protein
VTYPHSNAIRDRFFQDQRVKLFAMCAASWVDHETDLLTASMARLAEPIRRKQDGDSPRKTAIRYMRELERMGIFELIKAGGRGRGSRSTWRFLLQRASAEKCAPMDAHIPQKENVQLEPENVHLGPENVHASGQSAQVIVVRDSERYPEHPLRQTSDRKTEDPHCNCTKATAEANNEEAKRRAFDEMRQLLRGKWTS